MATKLQELLEELKELKQYSVPNSSFSAGIMVYKAEIDQLITKYTETTPTYKPGDSVRIIECISGHGFRIGEIVTLCSVSGNQFWKSANEDDVWYIKEEEFEPIN